MNASTKTTRVFIGNLPSDTVEEDVNKILKKYATVSTVEIKRRTNDVFAFVDLENLKLDLNTCFQELSRKQWKGQQLKVQLARESFLQRLARERLENNVSVKKENVSLKTQHNINYVKSEVNTAKSNSQKKHGKDDHIQARIRPGQRTDCSDDNSNLSDSEISKRGGLKMFCRSTALLQEENLSPPNISKLNANKFNAKNISEEKEILETFEMFNDVWRDEPSEISAERTNHNAENRFQKQQFSTVKRENVSLKMHHNNNADKGPESYHNSVVNTVNRNNQRRNGKDDHIQDWARTSQRTDCSDGNSDSSDSEIPTKGGLKMFRGTTVLHQETKKSQKIPSLNASKISTNKINEEKEILETFEMFNDVWRDEPSEISAEKTNQRIAENRFQKQKVKASSNSNIGMQQNETSYLNGNLDHNDDMRVPISQMKQAEAEERRLRAIDDRRKEILNRKHAIQFALASVDSRNINRPNKKIIITDDDDASKEESRNDSSSREPKLILFSDDEMETEMNNNNDFRIRKHYEGEKGKHLLSLQARYGNDRRFILDERFIESDHEQEGEKDVENDDTQAEREKVLRILGNVLGKDIPGTTKTKSKQSAKLMLRYDPSKPDHTRFEIKNDSRVQKVKKKKTIENDKQSNVVNPKEETNLPVVSKERYYHVSETLRETLENKDQKFSLSAMFEEENENESEKDNDVNLEAKPIIGRKGWSLKPFQNDSSDSEGDENEANDQSVPGDHCSEHNVGVKQESLFFEENDTRFTEGLDFISSTNEEYTKNFDKIRHHMKNIIKHKVQNHKRNFERQRKMFGGRKKTIFPGKRLKSNFRR